VTALRLAAERGRTGENYLIAGHRLSVAALAEVAGKHRPVTRRVAPLWTARACAPLGKMLAQRTGSSLLPTPEALHALVSFPSINTAKAARELGYQPRPIDDTISALHTYFVHTGRLPAPRAGA
jgi:dihydroflavonol-4-reductase